MRKSAAFMHHTYLETWGLSENVRTCLQSDCLFISSILLCQNERFSFPYGNVLFADIAFCVKDIKPLKSLLLSVCYQPLPGLHA